MRETMKNEITPVAQRVNVRVGKRPETPDRITVTCRIKLETKEQLEKLSGQLTLSQTAVIEKIVDWFANTSDLEAQKIKLETQRSSLKRQLSKTNEKLKKLNLKG
tara:strand:+ start:270 stop:584 length:315 start_codon:yes stop_codon:yes gene_type:complete